MPEITLYSRTVCQPCTATKRKIKKEGVEEYLVEINVELPENEHHAEHLRSLGYKESPVVMTSYGDEWSGFRPDLIMAFRDKVKAEAEGAE